MIALTDATDSRGWLVEGGATSSHHSGSKWGHFRLAHSRLIPASAIQDYIALLEREAETTR